GGGGGGIEGGGGGGASCRRTDGRGGGGGGTSCGGVRRTGRFCRGRGGRSAGRGSWKAWDSLARSLMVGPAVGLDQSEVRTVSRVCRVVSASARRVMLVRALGPAGHWSGAGRLCCQ